MDVRELLLDHWADLPNIWRKDASQARLTYKLYFMTLGQRSRSLDASKFDLFVYASRKVLGGSNIFVGPGVRHPHLSCVCPKNWRRGRLLLKSLQDSRAIRVLWTQPWLYSRCGLGLSHFWALPKNSCCMRLSLWLLCKLHTISLIRVLWTQPWLPSRR